VAVPTITPDGGSIHAMESTGGLSVWGGMSLAKWGADSDFVLEGNYCVAAGPSTTGESGIGDTLAAALDVTTNRLLLWVNVVSPLFVNTADNFGVYIRICTSSSSWTTDYRDFVVGGSDVAWVGKGWHLIALDCNRIADRATGTTTLTNINRVGIGFNVTATASKSSILCIDNWRYGTKVEVTGVTSSSANHSFTASTNTITRSSGSFTTDGFEVGDTIRVSGTVSNDGEYTLATVGTTTMTTTGGITDESSVASNVDGGITLESIYQKDGPTDDNWYGIVSKNRDGDYEINYKMIAGDESGSSRTFFISRGETVIMADQPLGPGMLGLFSDVDTGNTIVVFGESSGTGDSRVGFSGSTVKQDDTFFGTRDPQVYPNYYRIPVGYCRSDDGGSFTNEDTDINSATANDVTILPATAADDDALYIGADSPFSKFEFNIGTARGGTMDIVWEYYNGSSWVPLPSIVDGTSGFTNTGASDIEFFTPTDWTSTTVNSTAAYWIRGRVTNWASGGGGLGTQGWLYRVPVPSEVDLSVSVGTCEVFGTAFQRLKGGVSFAADTGHYVTNCTFDRCAQVSMGSVEARNLTFSGYEETSKAHMLMTSSTDVENSRFLANNRAIEHTAVGSYTYTGLSFSGNIYDIVNSINATTTDSYSESNQDSTQQVYGGGTEGVGQSITGDGNKLTSVSLYLRKVGTPTGNAVVKLYAHSGTFGTSSIPTGVELATSKNLDVSTLDTSYALIKVELDDSEFYTLVNATKYVITVEYSGGGASNRLEVGYDGSSPTHGGNKSTYNGATWSSQSGDDMCFYVRTGGDVTVGTSNSNPSESKAIEEGTPEGVINVNAQVTFKITGLPTSTEVTLIKFSDDTEIDHVENTSGDYTYAYNYTGDIAAYAHINHIDWLWKRVSGITLGSSDQTIPLELTTDRVYDNPT
jgi:hypothetical protein